MRDVFLESGYMSLIKCGEQLCGDRVMTINDENYSTIVLSDGLGSGVKANILSTITAKILVTMMSAGMSVEECVNTVAETLPVCKVRRVAYSTFTILRVHKNGDAYLVQFDNPMCILLRGGKSFDYETTERVICGKRIYESRFEAKIGDIFILMSDGAIHAGVGQMLNFGWERENIIDYAETVYEPDMGARTIAARIAETCRDLYDGLPGDDTTIAAMKVRKRETVNLMIGPPQNKDDDEKIMRQFFGADGKRIVCGGTTSQVVSRYLDKPVVPELDYEDASIPPIAHISGVDLVTEGVITIGRVLEYAQDYCSVSETDVTWKDKKDGASLICKLLLETATDVNFFVGRAINPSHQNPDLPISFNIKMNLINSLAECLKKLGKTVDVKFY